MTTNEKSGFGIGYVQLRLAVPGSLRVRDGRSVAGARSAILRAALAYVMALPSGNHTAAVAERPGAQGKTLPVTAGLLAHMTYSLENQENSVVYDLRGRMGGE